jgi:heat shock protein HslJ
MKQWKILILLVSSFHFFDAGAQIKAGTIVRGKEVYAPDSIVFYETDYATQQKSFMDLLAGTWRIISMKKQSQMEQDTLAGVTLTLNRDSSFTGQASCNKIRGRLSIKGTSIKFKEVAATKMTCTELEEEKLLLQLLRESVTNYTVDKASLLLRDVSGNIVFEAKRKTL